MGKELKKFRCMNCGKTFEIPATAEDPLRCPYCGMGPGVLIRVQDDRTSLPPQPPTLNPPQRIPPPPVPPGPVPMKRFMCYNCNRIIEVPYGVPKPIQCPYCGAPHYMIHRVDPGGRGWGRGRGFGRGWRRYAWW